MIIFDDSNIKPGIVFTEEGDTLFIENDYLFGVKRLISFMEDISIEGEGVFFEKYFQYTIDGVHWSEWISLNNFNLSIVEPKFNHIFSIKYKYIRSGSGGSITLHSIKLNIEYQQLPIPSLYNNSYFNKYTSFYNKSAINWAVNVLNKIYQRGIIPKFIERGGNINWEDEDFIHFWWTVIYLVALKLSYLDIFNIINNTELLRKYLLQKDILPGEKGDLAEYYYLLTHYYDEIMKRGSVCIFDKQRGLPSNFKNVKIRGELLRFCNQPETIESIFGIIRAEETGWVIGQTCPGYTYNDSYVDFIKGFEFTESVNDLHKYPIVGDNVSLEEVEINNKMIQCIKINTGDNSVYEGVEGHYSKSILVDNESDYEISFKVRGLINGNGIKFGVKGYNFLGVEVPFANIQDETETNLFLDKNDIEGDLFFRGFIRYKSFGTLEKLPEDLVNLKFLGGTEKISPIILISSENNVYIYDIKIKNLPVSSCQSTLLNNNELVLKIIEGYSSLPKDQIIEIILSKLVPVHTIVTTSERDVDADVLQNNYLPYILPFNL